MRQQEHFGGNGREKGERRNKKMKSGMFWRKWLGKRGKKGKKEKEKREDYDCGVAKKRGKKRRKYRWKKKSKEIREK